MNVSIGDKLVKLAETYIAAVESYDAARTLWAEHEYTLIEAMKLNRVQVITLPGGRVVFCDSTKGWTNLRIFSSAQSVNKEA